MNDLPLTLDMSNSKHYIHQVATHFKLVPLMFQVLHAHGQDFPNVSEVKPDMGPMGQCFVNAFELSRMSGLHYVEGYAVAGNKVPIPLEHAWCVDDDGLVYDPTWADGCDYFGVAFQPSALNKIMGITRKFSVFGNLPALRMAPEQVRELMVKSIFPINVKEHNGSPTN